MTFYYKGNLTTDPGEHYLAISRSGFMRHEGHGSKKLVLDALERVSGPQGVPLGTVVKIEKLYRMKRGYEPDAPFRHGDLAEVWTLRLKAHSAWHDPKTGKAKPSKWETIDHSVRSRSGEDFRDPRAGRHEAGRNPRVSRPSPRLPAVIYERPQEPSPMTADDALLEATYWLHDRNAPENALPWLVYAGRHGRTKEDFDDIARIDAQIEKRAPEKWRLFQRGALKIPMVQHPKSVAALAQERALRQASRSPSASDAALRARVSALVGKK